MWRLKNLIPKDQAGLEGKTVEVGGLKLQVRSTIAQGGFSCVYLARDSATGAQYAVKHIICNDVESVDLVKSEVSVMKALRGHPNVVALQSQTMYDMGRTKECFLVMEYCEKMLANVLENRGAGYFDEKQILVIFRDVCNAAYAMHCLSPPIAHRDLKAENVLMGGDGLWKLCDFGSTSTNHKRFEKPDEMGLEEDIIRKYTTPAYRAPEMWDLYRRELINEKVDVWALGCLLYKIAYLKPAFDGESKLQILNGNYRIPEAPRYSTALTDLIRDMLSASPDKRPDVIQIWRRVNDALPSDARKHHPDKPASATNPAGRVHSESRAHGQVKGSAIPGRSPPLPPTHKDLEPASVQNGTGATAAGAFWSTPYAQNSRQDASLRRENSGLGSPRGRPKSPGSRSWREDPSISDKSPQPGNFAKKKSSVTNLIKRVQGSVHSAGGWGHDDHEHNGYEMRRDTVLPRHLDEDEVNGHISPSVSPAPKASPEPSNDPAFNHFAAKFDNSGSETAATSVKERELKAELETVNKELQQALADKVAALSDYEKLTVVCRSQQEEIQGLKASLGKLNSPLVSPASKTRQSPATTSGQTPSPQPHAPRGWQAFDQAKEKRSASIWDLQEGLSAGGSPSPKAVPQDSNPWQPFPTSVRQIGADGRRRSMQHTRAASMGGENWAFTPDTLSSSPSASIGATQAPTGFSKLGTLGGSSSGRSGTDSPATRAPVKSQPAGWAGF